MEKLSNKNNNLEFIDKKEIPELETTNKVIEMSESTWIKDVTDKVLKEFPSNDTYTCAAGISPSGIVHFGNFRDVMTASVVFNELAKRGKNTRFIFSWDDFDRFRKVPANVDPSFSQYIGLPLSAVPDPTGETESYAKHMEREFEKSMEDLGIEMEYRYQSDEYKSGAYDDLIIRAMQSRTRIAEILLSFMSDKGKENKNIDEKQYTENYYPISIYSNFTGKDNTKIVDYDGDSKVTYICLDTGNQETIDLKKDHIAKLSWKVDWPMRWKKEKVVFEPGGHDHSAPGGSYDTSSVIAREIFDIAPPVFVGYEFIGIRGMGSKMSGSKGNAVTPSELLKIYEPEVLKWLYLRKTPHQRFELAFDTEVYRQYDEYDRAIKDYLEKSNDSVHARSLSFLEEAEQGKYKNPIPFRQAVAFGQMSQWNVEKVKTLIERTGLKYDLTSVAGRLQKARDWLEEYNPEEVIRLREDVNEGYVATMDENSKNLIREFRNFLLNADLNKLSIEEFEEALYHIPKKEYVPEVDLKKVQRAFFKDVYHLLINKDTGPRLPTFVWAVDKKKILELVDI